MCVRCGEMAAEVERLQGLIDAANAQEPARYEYFNEHFGRWFPCENENEANRQKEVGRKTVALYSHPIPAQQSYDQALQLLAESRENYEKQFGFSSDADWVYKDLAELFISDLPAQQSSKAGHDWNDQDKCKKCGDRDWYASAECSADTQQSPAVAVLDSIRELISETRNNNGFTEDALGNSMRDGFVKALDLLDAKLYYHPLVQSLRITEQDALQKLRTEVGEAINILAMCGDKTPFDQLGKKLVAAFNDSSSPKLNEAKHD